MEFAGRRNLCRVEFPIQVEDLKRRLDAKDDVFVLDVREPHEYQICNLGGYLIPLNDLPKRVVNSIPAATSSSTAKWVAAARKLSPSSSKLEFTVHNLAGGITAWSDRVDPKVPKY